MCVCVSGGWGAAGEANIWGVCVRMKERDRERKVVVVHSLVATVLYIDKGNSLVFRLFDLAAKSYQLS